MNTINNNKDALIAATIGAGAGPAVITALIEGVGFTTDGITKGSTAAKLMAKFGGAHTHKGGIIAKLQSIGAAGLDANGIGLTATGGALIVGGGYVLYKHKDDIIRIIRTKTQTDIVNGSFSFL